MHRFNGHDIEITQGDTLLFRIVLEGRELPEGSVGYFTVKKNPKHEDALIEKKMNAGDGELVVQLDSADTNLPARTYYWDVRLLIPRDDGGYEVETPMEYAAFTVLEAVGEAGEYDDGMDADVPVISQLIKEAREALSELGQAASNANGKICVAYDGSGNLDVVQGEHTYGIRRYYDPDKRLENLLIDRASYNGEVLFDSAVVENGMKLAGQENPIGGIYGNELMNDWQLIADGVDITESACEMRGVNALTLLVETSVYTEDGEAIADRLRLLTFHGKRMAVRDRWNFHRPVTVERWAGSGSYSVRKEPTLGYTSNVEIRLMDYAYGYVPNFTSASFWIPGTMITVRAMMGADNECYLGSVEDKGDRFALTFDTIRSETGVPLESGAVLEASYEIEVV